MTPLLVIGVVVFGLTLAVSAFGLWRNDQVAAYFRAVLDHVYEVNVAAIRADGPTLDWTVVERTMRCWDRMMFMPWKPLAAWFPPEYRP